MTDTSIEWTDVTWNPVRGCSMARGSETKGCLNCYAARMAARRLPWSKGLARQTENGPRWTGLVYLAHDKLDEPLRWRTPRKAFVNSMSDLLHHELPEDDIAGVFAVMALAGSDPGGTVRGNTFQVLTKRADRLGLLATDGFRNRVARYVESAAEECPGLHATRGTWPRMVVAGILDGSWWPLPSVWLGVSVEDQATADERIPLLLQTPAAKRFVSYEPALGPVDFRPYVFRNKDRRFRVCARCLFSCNDGTAICPNDGAFLQREDIALDWIIVGGESGPGARPFDVAWARSTVEQCKAAGVAVFVKQLGAHITWSGMSSPGQHWPTGGETYDTGRGHFRKLLASKKGGDPSEWPADLRVREYPR